MAYYVYILTNKNKTVFYTGFTNNLKHRVKQHEMGKVNGFSKKYNCYYLLYYEKHEDYAGAILREKQVKKFGRRKKFALIEAFNPDWRFLNDEDGIG